MIRRDRRLTSFLQWTCARSRHVGLNLDLARAGVKTGPYGETATAGETANATRRATATPTVRFLFRFFLLRLQLVGVVLGRVLRGGLRPYRLVLPLGYLRLSRTIGRSGNRLCRRGLGARLPCRTFAYLRCRRPSWRPRLNAIRSRPWRRTRECASWISGSLQRRCGHGRQFSESAAALR